VVYKGETTADERNAGLGILGEKLKKAMKEKSKK
jgi:hypothetical protein